MMMNYLSATIAQSADDYLETTNVFGEVRRTITSKNFCGGKVNVLFGETRLDFSAADINGVVVLDLSVAFAETKIIVPPNWRVETDISNLLATVKDKRKDLSQIRNTDKVLVIIGSSLLADLKILHP